MAGTVFKTACGVVILRWVGSIPTYSRQLNLGRSEIEAGQGENPARLRLSLIVGGRAVAGHLGEPYLTNGTEGAGNDE